MLEKVSLFNSKREIFLAFFITAFIATYAILIEYNNFKQLTRFDSNLTQATLLKKYDKTKVSKKGKIKKYQVLKLKSTNGYTFYTSTKPSTKLFVGQKVNLEIWAGKINFYQYMSGFYAFSKIIHIDKKVFLKQKLNTLIQKEHQDKTITSIYQALFTAKGLDSKIQSQFSSLGISHLVAISGFHLGVLSALLFFLFKYPYTFFQQRYFPYRSYRVDSFFFISIILLAYLVFLDYPPSLLRAFFMLLIGFLLYDRGIKVVSQQTLLVTIILLLALFPKLLFSIGFWLSVSGVFYIFLFLIHFKHLSKIWQFILIPFWVYILMLPYSIIIFGNFSLYHPLSIIWTSLFTLFYPLSIFLHLINQGNLLDGLLQSLLGIDTKSIQITLDWKWLILDIFLSLATLFKKVFLFPLFLFSLWIFFYSYSELLLN
ncbi:MAG: ComEC/Rec2 family competence protein [Sulfurimonas sp.]